MALTTKLVMRQSQSLVMTPQLLQAIKLLQFSNLDLTAFIEEELERNPLLERAEESRPEPHGLDGAGLEGGIDPAGISPGEDFNKASEADGSSAFLTTNRKALEAGQGTELSNSFDDGRTTAPGEHSLGAGGLGLSVTSWSGPSGGTGDGAAANLEAYIAAPANLKDHLELQLGLATAGTADRLTGQVLIDSIDENGYFTGSLDEIAARLHAPLEQVERILRLIQGFDPSGVGARDLAECLSIQLRERDRFDPAMQALVGHLDLLAKRDFAGLKKICGVSEEDLLDMVGEIRNLNPKPGLAFGTTVVQPIVPDVFVRPGADGSFVVELNSETLPKVLVNQIYYAQVAKTARNDKDKTYLADCLQTATWLIRALDQRARTILKVSTEIVRQQDAFFAHGVQHLRPLNLKTVADAIAMHESTVSRVTANKYMATTRGN